LRVCAYELNTCDEFLLFKIFPNTKIETARLGETTEELLQRISQDFDVFAFHLDITNSTCIPLDRKLLVDTLKASGKLLINHAMTDISKMFVQECCIRAKVPRTLARKEHSVNYPVIVKTKNNYGGNPEKLVDAGIRNLLGIELDESHKGPLHYQFSELHSIGNQIWSNQHLLVERFISNQEERFFRAYFLFDRLVVSKVNDPARLKKMPIGIERTSRFFHLSGPIQTDSDFPVNLVTTVKRFITASGAQFGALDIVHDDLGNYYVIDLNLTPHWGDGGHSDLIRFLRESLD